MYSFKKRIITVMLVAAFSAQFVGSGYRNSGIGKTVPFWGNITSPMDNDDTPQIKK